MSWNLLVASANTSAMGRSIDIHNGAETPFGRPWRGDVFTLATEHITALQAGQALVLDVMNEYVVFLKAEPGKEITNWEGARDGG